MAAAVFAIASAFATTASTVASAIGLSAATAASIGAAVGSGVLALGGMAGLGSALSAWGTVLAIGSTVATLTQKVPKPPSASVQLDTKLDPNPPRTVAFGRTAVAGTALYQAVSGVKQPNDNIRLSRVIGLSVGPITEFEKFLVGDKELTFSNDLLYTLGECTNVANTVADSKLFRGNFRQGHSLGQTPEPSAPPTYTGTAMPGLSASSKFSGIAHATQHLDFLAENFPNGDPKGAGFRWIIKGVPMYDPRKDSTYPGGSGSHRFGIPSTYEWSENPIIVGLNFALAHKQNDIRVWGIGADYETVDVESFVQAANVADENEWTCGGEFSAADDKYPVLATILQAGSAVPVNNAGRLSCFINTPMAAVLTLTGADIVGNVEITTTTAWRDRKNRVLPFYREETQNWQIVGGEPVSGSSYLSEDGGDQKTVEVSYPYCQNARQAHQLGAYELVNTREFLQFTATCSPRLALNAKVGDCLMFDLPEVAAGATKVVVMSRDLDPMTWQVTLTMRAETDAKHAFALGQTQEAPPSPGLSGDYDPSNPNYPGAGGMPTWEIIDNKLQSNGVTIPALVVSGYCDDNNAREILIDYRRWHDDDWINHTSSPINYANGLALTQRFDITAVDPGVYYEVAVSYRNQHGIPGGRLVLGPVRTADFRIPTYNVWDVIGNVAISDLLEAISEDVATVANAALAVDTIVDDINLLGETALEAQLRDLEIRDELVSLTYLNGNTVANAVTLVRNDLTETIDGQNAIVNTISLIGAANANGTAFILNTDLVRVSNTESLAERFDAISTSFDTANALIIETANAFATANAATASEINLVKASVANATAAIQTEANARVSGDTAIANELHLLGSKNGAGTAFVLNTSTTMVNNSTSLAQQLTSLQAASDGANARVITATTSQASNNAAFASQISSAFATANGASSSATIALNASSTQGSRVTISTNVNGHVAGTQLINGGAGLSSFVVLADRFVVGSSALGAITTPFIVSGSTVYMDNVIARNIGANTITADKIVGGAVTTSSWSEQGYGGTPGGGQVFALAHSTEINYAPHQIVFNVGISNFSGMNGMAFNFYRNGGFIGQRAFITQGSYGYSFAGMIFDQPTAGYNVYSVTASLTSGSQSAPVLNWVNMMILELKK